MNTLNKQEAINLFNIREAKRLKKACEMIAEMFSDLPSDKVLKMGQALLIAIDQNKTKH
jgi:hypothetical protein